MPMVYHERYILTRRTTFTFNGDKEVAKRAKIDFKRACDRLGIDIITTSAAQAKGRVERNFRTLQDRFVKELRIQRIVNYHQAEDYLVKLFIPDHNKRCGKPPCSPASAFRPLTIAETTNLDIILACHRTRTILNGNVVSYNHAQYMPVDDNGGHSSYSWWRNRNSGRQWRQDKAYLQEQRLRNY